MKNWFKKLFKKETKQRSKTNDFFGMFYDFRFEDQQQLREGLGITEKALAQFCYDTYRNPIYIYLMNVQRDQAIKQYLDPERLLDGRDDKQKYRDVISFIAGITRVNDTIKDYASNLDSKELSKMQDNSTVVYKSIIN